MNKNEPAAQGDPERTARLELTRSLSALIDPMDRLLAMQEQNALSMRRLSRLFAGGLGLGVVLVVGVWVVLKQQQSAVVQVERVHSQMSQKLTKTPADVFAKVEAVSSSVASVQDDVDDVKKHTELGGHPELERRVEKIEKRLGIKPRRAPLKDRVEKLEREVPKR